MDIASLKTHVTWLKVLLGGLAGAGLAITLATIDKIDKVKEDITGIKETVAGHTTTLGQIKDALIRIDGKLDKQDDNPQGSPRDGQTPEVHQGTQGREGRP